MDNVYTARFAGLQSDWSKRLFWLFGSKTLAKKAKIVNFFKTLYSNVRPIWWGMSLENPQLYFSKINIKFPFKWLVRLLSELPYNTMQSGYRDNSEDKKIIQTNHFSLLLLRNATKHNSTQFSVARLHVSADKFWNSPKDFACNNVKRYWLLVLKKKICITCFRLTLKAPVTTIVVCFVFCPLL